MKKVALVLTALALTVGCQVKHKEQKSEIGPNAFVEKTELTGRTYSLVRGIEDADRNDLYLVPGFSDDFGLVEVRVLENELQMVAVGEPNKRPETASVVASFPITDHFDVEKERNDFGEETHRTVEKRERPWNERRYMRVDWSKNSRSLAEIGEYFGVKLSDNANLLEGLKINGDHLSFVTNHEVAGAGLPGESIRVKTRTHLIARKGSDFTPVPYRGIDFRRYGYFYTQQNIEDPEKGLLDSNIQRYANVHNVCQAGTANSCSTNKVVWVLNEGFPEKYLETTRKAVADWNVAFQKSLGRSDNVIVLDESRRVPISEPTSNVIALYPHASGGGLLGVAQFVTDSRTGEFIATRATVYEEGISYQLGVVDTYLDEVLNEPALQQMLIAQGDLAAGGVASSEGISSKDVKEFRKLMGLDGVRQTATRTQSHVVAREGARALRDVSLTRQQERKLSLKAKAPDLFSIGDFGKIGKFIDAAAQDPLALIVGDKSALEKERKESILKARLGVHSSEIVAEPVLRFLIKSLKKNPDMASKAQMRASVKKEVEQLVFYTTLLHEMGHAFGLRHNFMGSADQDNFNSNFKAIAQKVKAGDKSVTMADAAPYAYSSIMDYGAEFFDGAGGLGSYDQSAIEYAYTRVAKVQDRDAKFKTKVAKSGAQLFCTDNNVNESLLCRRFDEGSNVNQILKAQIDNYQRRYALTHFRRDRASFNSRLWSYLPSVYMNLLTVRQAMDELIYAFITSPNVNGASEGECTQSFSYQSVKAGEIANICDPLAAELAGVKTYDLSTLVNGLFDPETGALLKDPSTYIPNGLADLVLANYRAQTLFSQILGAPEPGVYLAETVDGASRLTLLEGSSDEERLSKLAEDRDVADVEAFVSENLGNVTELKAGGQAKLLESRISNDGERSQLDVLGFVYDKIAALYVLGTRDLGVTKYSQVSMNGNAYSYPQTKSYSSSLMQKLIAKDALIAPVSAILRSGKTVRAVAPAALNLDTQVTAMVVGVLDFATDQDASIVEKMRVCDASETSRCAQGLGPERVEMESASGQTKFIAAQTFELDSIVVPILKQGADIAKQRSEAFAKAQNMPKLIEENQKSLELHATVAKELAAELAVFEGIGEKAHEIFDIEQKGSALWLAKLMTDSVAQGQLFQSREVAISSLRKFGEINALMSEVFAKLEDPAEKEKLIAISRKVSTLGQELQTLLIGNLQLIQAPIVVKQLSSDLQEKEGTIRLLRRFLQLTGQN